MGQFWEEAKYIRLHCIEVAVVRFVGSSKRCTVPEESHRRDEDGREAKSHAGSFHSLEWHMELNVSDGSTRCTQKLAEMRKDESHEESFYSLEWHMESHVSDGST